MSCYQLPTSLTASDECGLTVSRGCPKWRCPLGSQCPVSAGGCPCHMPLHIHGSLIGAEGAGHLIRLVQTSHRSSTSSHHHPSVYCQLLVPPAPIPQSLPTAVVSQQHEVPLVFERSWSFWGASTRCRDLERAGQGGTWDSGGVPERGSAASKQD